MRARLIRLVHRLNALPGAQPAGQRAASVRLAVAAMIIAGAVAMLLGSAQIARRQHVIQLGYELSQAIEDLGRAQEENRRLRLEKAVLTSPDRIRRLAGSLGMTQPGPDQIRLLPETGPETEPEKKPDVSMEVSRVP